MAALASTAHAVLVTSADRVRLTFDFAGQLPPPPYHNINFRVSTSLANDINAGEGFKIQAFSPNDDAVSNQIAILVQADSGGALESGFGGPPGEFFGVLTGTQGYLEMTDIVGTFDLTAFRVLAANLNYFPPGTEYIDTAINVFAVSEPSTVTLALASLIVLGGLRRIGGASRLP